MSQPHTFPGMTHNGLLLPLDPLLSLIPVKLVHPSQAVLAAAARVPAQQPPPPSAPPLRTHCPHLAVAAQAPSSRPSALLAADGTHWSAAEKARFSAAQTRFGPFAWTQITDAVRTRSMKQVKAFSARTRHNRRKRARTAASNTSATSSASSAAGAPSPAPVLQLASGDASAASTTTTEAATTTTAAAVVAAGWLHTAGMSRDEKVRAAMRWVDAACGPDGGDRDEDVEPGSPTASASSMVTIGGDISDIDSDDEAAAAARRYRKPVPAVAADRSQPIREELSRLLDSPRPVRWQGGKAAVMGGVAIDFDQSDLLG